MARSLWQALIFTLLVVVAIKWLTGIAFAPLLALAILVLTASFGLSLRLQRALRQD